jgi:hypothetical protein
MEVDPVIELKTKSILATLERRRRLLNAVHREGPPLGFRVVLFTIALLGTPCCMLVARYFVGISTHDEIPRHLWTAVLCLFSFVLILLVALGWTHRRLQALIDLLALDEAGMVTAARHDSAAD